jgi:large subunit ribosomal protein L10
MSKVVKRMLIDDLRGRLGDNRDLLVLNTSKLTPDVDNQFRLTLRQKGIKLMTVKNSLAKVVLREAGVKGVDDLLAGPSVLVWGGEDVVALSKELAKWAKDVKEIEIKGGAIDGQTLDTKGVEDLGKSPGRLELLSKISGMLLSPAANLAGALLGPGGYLCGQLKAQGEKEEAAA